MSLSVINSLAADSALFKGRRIIAIGDICLDRTLLYTEPHVPHARHESEINFDIESDDYGEVGGIFNICKMINTFDASSLLITAAGSDKEGDDVRAHLTAFDKSFRCFMVPGPTATRFRFFELEDNKQAYTLKFRFNKEPDLSKSYSTVEAQFKDSSFSDWLAAELRICDVLVLNDFEKGFLSEAVIKQLVFLLRSANQSRLSSGLRPIISIVDPKHHWQKFTTFPATVFKPNHKEAAEEVGFREYANKAVLDDAEISTLASEVYKRFGAYFPNIVISLGPKGAVSIRNTSRGASVRRFPRIDPPHGSYSVATHCGDVFDGALALALAIGEEDDSAIVFGNCAGALQFSKLTGHVISRDDLQDRATVLHIQQVYRSSKPLPDIFDEEEMVALAILERIGKSIDYRNALYIRNGVTSKIIAGPEFKSDLDKLATLLQPGNVVFIDGQAGSGKSALISNFDVFVDGYTKSDCYPPNTILKTPDALQKAIEVAESRKTCIIIDEIHTAATGGIAQLLMEFGGTSFSKPFVLVCVGHADHPSAEVQDLLTRSKLFLVKAYSHTDRKSDIPFLVAQFIRTSTFCNHVKWIHALALRELLRCNFESVKCKNHRCLSTVLKATCSNVTKDRIEWLDLDFAVAGLVKPHTSPMIADLDYFIEIG